MRFFFGLLLLILACGPGVSAQVPEPEPLLKVSGFTFAISVADLKASTEWYATKFGLRVTKRIPKTNGVAVTLLEGGGLMLELIERDGSKAVAQVAPQVKEPTELQGIFKVGILVENYEQVLKTLKVRDVAFAYGPYPAHDDQRANVILRDNSGNLIQLFQK